MMSNPYIKRRRLSLVFCNLLVCINMRHEDCPAAVALYLQFVQNSLWLLAHLDSLAVCLPHVCNNAATAETSQRNYHLIIYPYHMHTIYALSLALLL